MGQKANLFGQLIQKNLKGSVVQGGMLCLHIYESICVSICIFPQNSQPTSWRFQQAWLGL